jgi:hypothetical protein
MKDRWMTSREHANVAMELLDQDEAAKAQVHATLALADVVAEVWAALNLMNEIR